MRLQRLHNCSCSWKDSSAGSCTASMSSKGISSDLTIITGTDHLKSQNIKEIRENILLCSLFKHCVCLDNYKLNLHILFSKTANCLLLQVLVPHSSYCKCHHMPAIGLNTVYACNWQPEVADLCSVSAMTIH